ncbi:phosphoribosyltransferase [Mycobacterium phage Sheen]|uniref:Phosphoribosyltransferase n=1 Tax=Mycobacterium phage Sheen TaxID=1589274 RepID=A0A0B5A3N2_9CAUD|nr:phosphoribosyl transferase [Mycobacterium phage Sheen]AJD82484.1 phosphoribosyltransferase [Mycobacterium phage Sheen]
MKTVQDVIDQMNRQMLAAIDEDTRRLLWGPTKVKRTEVKVDPDLLASDLLDAVPQRVMEGAPAKPEPEVLDLTDRSYLRLVHDPEQLLKLIEPYLAEVEFDTFVGTGLSGTIAATEMAKVTGKNYLIARKPNDGTHSANKAEGRLGKRWLFIDDLIATGRTLGRVWDAVHLTAETWNFKTEFVGAVLYGDGSWYDHKFIPATECRDNLIYNSEYFQSR